MYRDVDRTAPLLGIVDTITGHVRMTVGEHQAGVFQGDVPPGIEPGQPTMCAIPVLLDGKPPHHAVLSNLRFDLPILKPEPGVPDPGTDARRQLWELVAAACATQLLVLRCGPLLRMIPLSDISSWYLPGPAKALTVELPPGPELLLSVVPASQPLNPWTPDVAWGVVPGKITVKLALSDSAR